MDILPVNFKVLRFCGAWNESEDRNVIVRLLKFIYRYLIVALVYHFALCEMLELIVKHNDIEDLTEGLFMTSTYAMLCLKYGNFLIREGEISELLNCFRSDTCQSKNSVEKKILDKYDRKAKWCALSFMALSQATGVALLTAPVLTPQNTNRPLPLREYLPYSITNFLPYVATYLQQILALTYGIFLNVSFDSLVYGFTIRTCGQIELLCYRLMEIFKNKAEMCDETQRYSSLRNCISHHLLIYEFVRRIQALFVWIVTLLFLFSLVTLCTSVFRLSQKSIFTVEFLSLTLYLGSMLFQIYFYCWYGNELELKSRSIAKAVYFSDWTNATVRERRNLLVLMTISQKGLRLSYYGVCALALSTFMWIMKTSYSSFNLLQRMSN